MNKGIHAFHNSLKVNVIAQQASEQTYYDVVVQHGN